MYGSETWTINIEQIRKFKWTGMTLLQWMWGVSLRDKLPSVELRERMGD